jgi:hypothetical protein
MPKAHIVVIRIMSGSDLDSSCSKGHIDENGIRNDGNTAVKEGMQRKFSMKMLASD